MSGDRRHSASSPEEQALLSAAVGGRVEALRRLLQQGVSPDCYDSFGEPAAHLAARFGNAAALAELLAAGVDVRDVGPIGQTLLHCMAPYPPVHGLLDEVIRRGADIDARNDAGQTPLMTATYNTCAAGLDALLARGAAVDVRDHEGSNVLLLFVRGCGAHWSPREAVVRLRLLRDLIVLGVDPLRHGAQGDNAVTAAARGGLDAVLSLFADQIGALAVATARTAQGEPGVDVAAFHGHAQTVQQLLRLGAAHDLLCAASLGDVAAMRRLVEADRVSARRVFGSGWHRSTALAAAIRNGHADAALWLLADGADANGTCPEISMLHAAMRHCPDDALVRALIARGADLESSDGDGNTPLNFAARHDRLSAARLLLAAGANPNAETERGYTPDQFAVSEAMRDLIQRHREA
ncbi:MAG: ankyrin repeat domain-containing protein [Xanthomonadales bacterium]|nr:ankyrin repeat domain-containing protein [Xanthomonadales bacterium]